MLLEHGVLLGPVTCHTLLPFQGAFYPSFVVQMNSAGCQGHGHGRVAAEGHQQRQHGSDNPIFLYGKTAGISERATRTDGRRRQGAQFVAQQHVVRPASMHNPA